MDTKEFSPDTHIGHIANQDNVEAIIHSIIDVDKDYCQWQGNEDGIQITINGNSTFIKNDDDFAAEVYSLWKSGNRQGE